MLLKQADKKLQRLRAGINESWKWWVCCVMGFRAIVHRYGCILTKNTSQCETHSCVGLCSVGNTPVHTFNVRWVLLSVATKPQKFNVWECLKTLFKRLLCSKILPADLWNKMKCVERGKFLIDKSAPVLTPMLHFLVFGGGLRKRVLIFTLSIKVLRRSFSCTHSVIFECLEH